MKEKKVISVTGLTKKFGDFTAVDKISFDIHQGEIFGFPELMVQVKRRQSACCADY